jgi:hypothetical protein
MPAYGVPVYLRHRERDLRDHAKSGTVIDHDRSGLRRDGRILPADFRTRREQRDVDPVKDLFCEKLDRQVLPLKTDSFSR